MRIVYNDKRIPIELTSVMFQADVLQHRAWAAVSDDAKDMEIIHRLFGLGIFSSIYTDSGLDMLRGKADDGYEPAVELLASIEGGQYQKID